MGRREHAVITDNRSLAELAEWLPKARALTGLTYTRLADRAGYHPTTLQRAASGKSVPRRAVVIAYARACGVSTDHARQL
ncbi:helix-turn-helix domain-containing protein [Streptomyces sp. NPDC014733]|uniref:helix-turn-helix domain-containing protein n=1 Tax=Streptomyces sp. NPDC014733 TaxID=3364885 RepID=UPI0036FB08AD